MLFMSEEDRKNQEFIIKNKRDMRAKMKADAEYKKNLDDLSMKDRHAKGQEKQEDAKARAMKYGANIRKFEPPKEQRGG